MLDRVTWEIVALYHGHPAPLEFAEILAQMAIYYDQAWIMGEYNDQGASVVPRLLSLYSRVCKRPDIQGGGRGEIHEDKYWFWTSQKSKKFLADQMKEAVENKPAMVPFPRFWKEAQIFVNHNGKLGAEGKHSDPSIKNFDDTMIAVGQCFVGHLYAPVPIENVVPEYAAPHARKEFERRLQTQMRSAVTLVPDGIKASRVL